MALAFGNMHHAKRVVPRNRHLATAMRFANVETHATMHTAGDVLMLVSNTWLVAEAFDLALVEQVDPEDTPALRDALTRLQERVLYSRRGRTIGRMRRSSPPLRPRMRILGTALGFDVAMSPYRQ